MKERLQKIIARAGLASRRKAEELIRQGRVTVNGQRVERLGTLADPHQDHIKVDGKLIRAEPVQSYAVYKPRQVMSTTSDPRNRTLVTSLVPSRARLYPAGRLDFASEGLIILTNDGELAGRLMQAGRVEKVYHVKVRSQPSPQQLLRLQQGLRLRGVQLAPCQIRPLRLGHNSWLEVRLKQGKNRQIRKMFQQIGHPVLRLRRVAIGGVELGNLRPGAYRKLTPEEIAGLKGNRKDNKGGGSKDVYRNRSGVRSGA